MLVRQRSQEQAAHAAPRLVVVFGGRRNLGTSTAAVNIAAALSRGSLRVVLVDADPQSAGATALCGVRPRASLADVFSARRTLSDALDGGPGGLQVVPGVNGLERLTDFPAAAVDSLLQGLAELEPAPDAIVVDGGNSPTRLMQRFWRHAAAAVALVAPDSAAVLDTYAAIKTLHEGQDAPPLRSLVNFAADAETADEVHARLARACQRFLGLSLRQAGYVPLDAQVRAAGRGAMPVVHFAPQSPTAQQFRQVAAWLVSITGRARASGVLVA